MSTLHLNLKKEWFDLIRAGDKPEEYREITEYWKVRLTDYVMNHSNLFCQPHLVRDGDIVFKKFDSITFSNGYAKDRSQFKTGLDNIRIAKGLKQWGAKEGTYYFALKLQAI